MLSRISKWADHHLKKMLPHIPTYIKDSFEFKGTLNKLKNIPEHALLFTADAKAMYDNIEPTHGLAIIENLIEDFKSKNLLENDFPTDFLLKCLGLIMTHNVFQFGPTYWLQTVGTAMGTPVAVTWAILYYGWLEIRRLLPTFNNSIITLKRLVDDMFCIWTGTVAEFKEFQEIANNFGLLKWKFTNLSNKVEFLDLNIIINKGNLLTYTYEKPHNLFLYIPFTSSHSSFCKRSLIWSLCYRFYHLNDRDQDYILQVNKLYKRLLKRGYPPANTKRIIIEATQQLENKPKKFLPSNKNNSTLPDSTFIYKTIFSNSLNKDKIKYYIKKHLHFKQNPESNFNFTRNIIAFRKDKNLLELLSPTNFIVPETLLKEFKRNSF